jgi:hypothetical protein
MSNSPFNEAGEPIMDAAAWRYEQELDYQASLEADYEDEYYYDDYDD